MQNKQLILKNLLAFKKFYNQVISQFPSQDTIIQAYNPFKNTNYNYKVDYNLYHVSFKDFLSMVVGNFNLNSNINLNNVYGLKCFVEGYIRCNLALIPLNSPNNQKNIITIGFCMPLSNSRPNYQPNFSNIQILNN